MTDPRALAKQIAAAIEQQEKRGSINAIPLYSLIERVLRAHQDAQAESSEGLGLYAFLRHEARDAHAMLDRACVPATKRQRTRDSEAEQDVTLGITDRVKYLVETIAACVQERDRLTADLQTHKLFSYAQTVELAEVREERDRLRTREATYHSLIEQLECLIDPEDHPDVQARIAAVLVDCENPTCALDNRLREVEAERDRLRGALEGVLNQLERLADAAKSAIHEASLAALPPTSAR